MIVGATVVGGWPGSLPGRVRRLHPPPLFAGEPAGAWAAVTWADSFESTNPVATLTLSTDPAHYPSFT